MGSEMCIRDRVEMDHDDQLDNQLIRVRMGGFNEEGTALKGVLV